MSECAFPGCKKEHCVAKQFNDINIRYYLCIKHSILASKFDAFNEGHKWASLIEKEYNEK